MVTNSGGLEDRSFNQSSWEGLQQAEDEYGIQAEAIVSTGETDLAPNVRAGRRLGLRAHRHGRLRARGGDARRRPRHNPDLAFAIVDETVEADNVKPVVFDTAQASYLAGYLAAGVSKTGVVATFGGGNQPPVTLFMDGFVDGVDEYNEAHGTKVQLLGWDKAAQDGAFTGDFEDVNKGKPLTAGLHRPGRRRDPAGGGPGGRGRGLGRARARRRVDHLGRQRRLRDAARPSTARCCLTSVLKNTQDAMVEIVGDVDRRRPSRTSPTSGTLENGGVDIAPYHDLAAARDARASTASSTACARRSSPASIVVESPSAP